MSNTSLKTILEDAKKVIATTEFSFPTVTVNFEDAHEGKAPTVTIWGPSFVSTYATKGDRHITGGYHEDDKSKYKKLNVNDDLKVLEDDELVEFCEKIGIEVEYLEEIKISTKATEFWFYNEDGDFMSIYVYNSIIAKGIEIYGIRAVDDEKVELDTMHIAQTMSDLSISEIESTLEDYAIKLRTYACGEPEVDPCDLF